MNFVSFPAAQSLSFQSFAQTRLRFLTVNSAYALFTEPFHDNLYVFLTLCHFEYYIIFIKKYVSFGRCPIIVSACEKALQLEEYYHKV